MVKEKGNQESQNERRRKCSVIRIKPMLSDMRSQSDDANMHHQTLYPYAVVR